MITSLEIQNFRGLKNVTLSELRRVNLIVGGNDTGKTSVLEALVLLLGDSNAINSLPCSFRNNQANGQSGNQQDDRENYWQWLFYDRDFKNKIAVHAQTTDHDSLELSSGEAPEGGHNGSRPVPSLSRNSLIGVPDLVLRFDANAVATFAYHTQKEFKVSLLPTRPPHPVQDAEKFNQIALESGGEERFEQLMRKIEPRLKRLRYSKLPTTTTPLVFADLGLSRFVPSTQMGQAFNRIFHIYAEILVSEANVLLIDEIENGIFSDSLPMIWKGLLEICESEGVQIFATTHSRECVMAAHNAAKERGKDELSVQRLQLVKGQVEAVHFDKEHLELAAEMGLEVRA